MKVGFRISEKNDELAREALIILKKEKKKKRESLEREARQSVRWKFGLPNEEKLFLGW